jgi:hypothetical protein
MKGSIPRSEFEAEMEKGSEEWNPKKYARRTDLGGRWKWRRELLVSAAGGLFGLSPKFLNLKYYILLYFTFLF